MKKIVIIVFLPIYFFGCQPIMMRIYGIKDPDIENEKTFKSLLGLVSLFNQYNIKFYFLENDAWFRLKFEKLGIEFPYIDFVQGFNHSFVYNKLTIEDDINYSDGHASVEGNKFACEKIYDYLIKNNIFIVK